MSDEIYTVVDGDKKKKDWMLPDDHPVLLGSSISDEFFSRKTMPAFGQGFIGSCVGVSGKLVAQDNINRDFSAMWIYQQAKLYDEFAGENYSGTSISGACRALKNVGVCETKFFPYEENEGAQPKVGAGVNASKNKIHAYYKILPHELDKMKSVLLKESLWCAFNLHEYLYNFYGKEIVDDEAYKASKSVGGHAVAIVGWKVIDGRLYWEMQNSWGSSFGNSGRFYMSATLFNEVAVGGVYYIDFEGEVLPPKNKRKKKSKAPVYIGIGAGVAVILGGILKFFLDK